MTETVLPSCFPINLSGVQPLHGRHGSMPAAINICRAPITHWKSGFVNAVSILTNGDLPVLRARCEGEAAGALGSAVNVEVFDVELLEIESSLCIQVCV